MAVAFKQSQAISDDELERLGEINPGYRFERTADGRLVVTPPTGGESGRRTLQIAYQVETWNRRCAFGYVFDSSTGFRMRNGAVLAPDVSVVRKSAYDALSNEQKERFVPLCPELAIEVKSPTDDRDDAIAKLRSYIENGAKAAILFDPGSGIDALFASGELTNYRRAPSISVPAGVLNAPDDLVIDVAALYNENA